MISHKKKSKNGHDFDIFQYNISKPTISRIFYFQKSLKMKPVLKNGQNLLKNDQIKKMDKKYAQ